MTAKLINTVVFFLIILITILSSFIISSKAEAAEIAIQDDGVFLYNAGLGLDKGINLLKTTKVKTIRINIHWSKYSSSPNSKKKPKDHIYDFNSLVPFLEKSRNNGYKVQATLMGPCPAFACGNKKVGYFKPNINEFNNFTRQSINFLNQYNVIRFSVWNEPNWPGMLAPSSQAPKIYRNMYQTSYKTIKSISSKNQVLFGELAPERRKVNKYKTYSIAPLTFIRQTLCLKNNYKPVKKCSPLKADGIAFHPYDLAHKSNYTKVPKDSITLATLNRTPVALRKVSKHLKVNRNNIYLTEYGYRTDKNDSRSVSFTKQRSYLKTSLQMLKKYKFVRQLVYYHFQDTQGAKWQSGIVDANGKPKSSFSLFK